MQKCQQLTHMEKNKDVDFVFHWAFRKDKRDASARTPVKLNTETGSNDKSVPSYMEVLLPGITCQQESTSKSLSDFIAAGEIWVAAGTMQGGGSVWWETN